MKFVSYNIQYSKGRDGRFDIERIARALEGADVIALQEVERNWPRSGMVDQPAELARLLPDYYWVYGPPFDMDASSRGEDGRIENRRCQFGEMLMAKTPIISSRLHLLPRVATTTHYNHQSGALEGVIETGAGPLRVFSIHLGHLSSRERLDQVRFLHDLNRRASVEGGAYAAAPTIPEDSEWMIGRGPPPMPADAVLMGDFNFDPAHAEYAETVGPMDYNSGRVGYADLFVDTWVAAGHGETGGVTWPGSGKVVDLRLDYCFVTPPLASRVKAAWIDNEADGSDHQPMWAEIGL